VSVTARFVSAPPVVDDGDVITVEVDVPFDFNITSEGNYRLVGRVAAGAVNGNNNSFCVDVDLNPGSGSICSGSEGDAKVWDLEPVMSFFDQNVSWRGAYDLNCFEPDCAQFNPKVWFLDEGKKFEKIVLNTIGR
jgi:hypothetical protein